MNEPTIPNAPAEPIVEETPEETEEEEAPKQKGGRPSNQALAAENKLLAAENDRLRHALEPFARIPDDPAKPDEAVLYVLNKGGASQSILARDLRTASRVRRNN